MQSLRDEGALSHFDKSAKSAKRDDKTDDADEDEHVKSISDVAVPPPEEVLDPIPQTHAG